MFITRKNRQETEKIMRAAVVLDSAFGLARTILFERTRVAIHASPVEK